jgi:hypothetical protein
MHDPPTNQNKNQSSLNNSETLYPSNNKDQHANYETNTTTSMNIMSKKDTPCPFLLRRGWCKKKQNCDFKHPRYSHRNQPSNRVPKHRMHCPFLRRKGFCLKGNQCDFLHSDSSNTHPPQGFDLNYLNPFLSYTQRTASPNLMQFHQRSNNTKVPLDFPMTSWPTYPWIQPLMNTPIYPPRLRW